ncbi:MAG: DUF86 domain-containing protein [Anaerolineae bacterium]|nr:DUF86 domain-containing protein [Anaerolineae bacterium]
MADRSHLEVLLSRLKQYRGYLEAFASIPREELLADVGRLGGVKYYLQVAVECCIDICNYIVAAKGWRTPRSYADCFVVLGEKGVLSPEFVATARQMAQFRNRLVHLYWEVSDEGRLHSAYPPLRF